MAADSERARENYEAYCYARDNGHTDYVNKAKKCEDYFAGLQWEETVRRALERQGRPALTINKIFAILSSIMGEQLKNRADITFRPSKQGTAETAEALAKTWIHIANTNRMDWMEATVFADGSITGRGFYDVRIGFDDHMMGEVVISTLNPRNVLVDPDAEEYDPETWKRVFLTKWLSLNDISLLYGKQYADELKAYSQSNFNIGYDSIDYDRQRFGGTFEHMDATTEKDMRARRIRIIEQQYYEIERREHFVDRATGDMRLIPSTFDRERIQMLIQNYNLAVIKRPTEVVRWLVTADNIVLHDEESPYCHFTPVPYFPYFRRGRTIGLVENILSPQDMLNKSLSQELHVINTTANSGWKVKQGALKNMDVEDLEQRGAETGLVVEVDDVANLEKITSNQIPTGLDRVGFKADTFMKEISGSSDSFRGFDREDVAAKAIVAKQVQGAVNLAVPFANLAATRMLLAERVLGLVQTYYTEERVLQITGRDLVAQTEQVVINGVTPEGEVVNDLTVGEYDVVVTTVPARETFDQAQFDELLQLRQLNIPIPDDILIEYSHVSRKAEIAKRMREATGGGSEEQQQAILQAEQQLRALETQAKMAETAKKIADARLAEARAAKTLSEIGQAGDGTQFDPMVLIEREKVAKELDLKKQQLEAMLQIKREELELKKQQYKQEFNLKVASAEAENDRKDEIHQVQVETAKSADKQSEKLTDAKVTATKQKAKQKPAAKKTAGGKK